MLGGILCGVGAALGQDFGYIFSRRFVRDGGKPGELLVHSQIMLGAVGVPLLAALLFFVPPLAWNFGWPLLGVAVGSGGGQYFFFRAERKMEPARVSALMGLRVALVAFFSGLCFGDRYSGGQWTGIALTVLAALALNWESGRFRLGGVSDLGVALGFYVLSDLSVSALVHGFGCPTLWQGAFYALAAVNVLTALVLLPGVRRAHAAAEFAAAAPFAGAWLVKQFLLYWCYALIGPVHGNVVLAFRGPLALLLALVWPNGEKRVSGGVWIQRGAATVLMTAALVLYSLG